MGTGSWGECLTRSIDRKRAMYRRFPSHGGRGEDSHGAHGGHSGHGAHGGGNGGFTRNAERGTRHAEPSDSHGATAGLPFTICDLPLAFAERKRGAALTAKNAMGITGRQDVSHAELGTRSS